MNFRVFRSSPPASTRGISVRSVIQPPPVISVENSFLQSWFEEDSKLDQPGSPGRINWNAVLGLVLVCGISAGFWAGVGWMVAALLN